MNAYNGWSGRIRDVRGKQLYDNLGKEVPHYGPCVLCGITPDKVSMSYHTEEYGSLYSDYLACAKCLCPHCHGIIHLRFKLPNRFQRFKQRISEGPEGVARLAVFPNLGLYFKAAYPLPDIPKYPAQESWIDWLDAIPLKAYSGPPKLATAIINGQEVPDPKIYGNDWDSLEGAVWRPNGFHNISFTQ